MGRASRGSRANWTGSPRASRVKGCTSGRIGQVRISSAPKPRKAKPGMQYRSRHRARSNSVWGFRFAPREVASQFGTISPRDSKAFRLSCQAEANCRSYYLLCGALTGRSLRVLVERTPQRSDGSTRWQPSRSMGPDQCAHLSPGFRCRITIRLGSVGSA